VPLIERYTINPLFAYASLFFASHLALVAPCPLILDRIQKFVEPERFGSWFRSALDIETFETLEVKMQHLTSVGCAIVDMIKLLTGWETTGGTDIAYYYLNVSATLQIVKLKLAEIWLSCHMDFSGWYASEKAFDAVKVVHSAFESATGDNPEHAVSVMAAWTTVPQNAGWHLSIGSALAKQYACSAAVSHYQEALRLSDEPKVKSEILEIWGHSVSQMSHYTDSGNQMNNEHHLACENFIAETNPDSSIRMRHWVRCTLFQRFQSTGSLANLNKAIDLAQQALYLPQLNIMHENELGLYLQARWECGNAVTDLESSIALINEELEYYINYDEYGPSFFKLYIVGIFHTRYKRTKSTQRMDEYLIALDNGPEYRTLALFFRNVLGDLHMAIGQKDTAFRLYETALLTDIANTNVHRHSDLQHSFTRCWEYGAEPIRGIRWMCEQCLCLDFCDACRSNGALEKPVDPMAGFEREPEHNFIELPVFSFVVAE
jgi:tetratricopeptide (TPR) repeat protein